MKKLLTILLALFMIFSLAACNQGGGNQGGNEGGESGSDVKKIETCRRNHSNY